MRYYEFQHVFECTEWEASHALNTEADRVAFEMLLPRRLAEVIETTGLQLIVFNSESHEWVSSPMLLTFVRQTMQCKDAVLTGHNNLMVINIDTVSPAAVARELALEQLFVKGLLTNNVQGGVSYQGQHWTHSDLVTQPIESFPWYQAAVAEAKVYLN